MAGQRIVPTPLTLADVTQALLHFGLCSTLVPGKLGIDVRVGQFFVDLKGKVIYLLLTLIDILTEGFCILSVTGLAGAVDVCKRTHDVVVGIFHTAF